MQLRRAYASAEELAQDHQQNLRKGRAFVVGAGVEAADRARCRLVLERADGATLALEAEVVWVKRDDPGAGVGVQLVDLSTEARAILEAFASGAPTAGIPAPAAEPMAPPDLATDDAPIDDEGDEPGTTAPGGARSGPRNLHERIRALTLREREVMARAGTLPERVALERCFGSSVWEGLLQNPQLTPPEVSRIAKNGTIPRPMVQLLVANAGWLQNAEVQRALLSNPRVSGPALDRVLRSMSKNDLQRVAALTAYRSEVRVAAKKLAGS